MAPSRIPQLLAFLEEDPADPFLRFALAQEYRKAGDSDAALRAFEQLVRESPDYVGTYYHLGKLYVQLGRTDDAMAAYRAGIAAATTAQDFHARSELQAALLEAEMGDL